MPIPYLDARSMTNIVEKLLTEPLLEAEPSGSLFDAHPAPSLLYGRDGRITHANGSAQSLLRVGIEAMSRASLAEFVPEIGQSLAQLQGAITHRRVAVRRADGSNFLARVQAVPLGSGETLLATFEDLTAVEQEVSAANREFETFVSAAGHDLRGPLRILNGFTEALEDECGAALNEEGRTFLKEILKASERMEGLVDGLLALSRATRAEMACEKLDLTTLVELVYYELRHGKNGREADCQVEPAISAWGDVRLMMSVLRTLLGNAWKYTSHTKLPAIRFYTEQRDGLTWCCVSDNGAGFDMAHAERLFKPFTRLHRQDEFPGFGLGLATVQRIVRRHGGQIAAEGKVGEGAIVRFTLGAEPV
jgi:signal transduction histidine kinase